MEATEFVWLIPFPDESGAGEAYHVQVRLCCYNNIGKGFSYCPECGAPIKNMVRKEIAHDDRRS